MVNRIALLFLVLFICFNSFAQLVELTLDNQGNPNEPSICFSKSNDSLLYAASNIDNFYTYNSFTKSIHKKKSKSKLGVYGDPVLMATDSSLYFAHLSKTANKSYGDWFDRIVVQKISDAENWNEQSYSVGFNHGKMQDKPWLSSSSDGDVFVTWTEFDKYDSDDPKHFSRIRFSALLKDSDSFSQAITISDTVGDCLDGDHTLEGATTAVDHLGNIYAVWAGHDNIYFDKSLDGGVTWGKDKIIAKQVKGWDMDMPNIMRANGMPFIVRDIVRDILHVCWADERNGNADIWLISSSDQGTKWSAPKRLNLDTTKSHQYFPNIAIDQETGTVYVAYYDFKSSPTNTFYSITLASYSYNGELTNTQLTPFVSALPGKTVFYGDYLDIDIHNNQLAVVYTAYDLGQKTEVNLIKEGTLSDGIFSKIGINNTPAIVRNGEIAQILLNVEHPHKTKIKVKTIENGKKSRHLFKALYTGKKTGWDQELGKLNVGPNTSIYHIKYRIRDLDVRHVYKRSISLK